jgi:hypothetical protein
MTAHGNGKWNGSAWSALGTGMVITVTSMHWW